MDLQFKEIEHALISNPKAKLYIQLNSEIYSSLCWLLDMKRNKEHKIARTGFAKELRYSPQQSTSVQQVQHQPVHSRTATANIDWIESSIGVHSQPYYPHATSSSLHHPNHSQMSLFCADPKMMCSTPLSSSAVMDLTSFSMGYLQACSVKVAASTDSVETKESHSTAIS
jgi:hypothetical protein